jgi:predicted DNA binding CopG/RHH family protein
MRELFFSLVLAVLLAAGPQVALRAQDVSRQARDSAGRRSVLETPMRKEYDFSQSRKNPYVKQLKRQVTIRLDTVAIDYFKKMAAELGMPYLNLINLFLRDCAIEKRRPVIQWPKEAARQPVGR